MLKGSAESLREIIRPLLDYFIEQEMPHVSRKEIFESCKPKIKEFKGRIQVFGTSGEIQNQKQSFRELWK